MAERESGTPPDTAQHAGGRARLPARTLGVDVVLAGSAHEIDLTAAALHHAVSRLRSVRMRLHPRVAAAPRQIVDTLHGLGRGRGRARGVLLAVSDPAGLVDAVDELVDRGVPVVTLWADVPLSRRSAFIGFDDENAGAAAARLVTAELQAAPHGLLLVTRHGSVCRDLRELGFRKYLRRWFVRVGPDDDGDGCVRRARGSASRRRRCSRPADDQDTLRERLPGFPGNDMDFPVFTQSPIAFHGSTSRHRNRALTLLRRSCSLLTDDGW